MKDMCKPGGCSSIGCEGGHYCFEADGTPKIVTEESKQKLHEVLQQIFLKNKDGN